MDFRSSLLMPAVATHQGTETLAAAEAVVSSFLSEPGKPKALRTVLHSVATGAKR